MVPKLTLLHSAYLRTAIFAQFELLNYICQKSDKLLELAKKSMAEYGSGKYTRTRI